MALRLNDEFVPDSGAGDEIQVLQRLLQKGKPDAQHAALTKLVSLGAESALLECLASDNPLTVQLATGGLWDCWLNERGPAARREMDRGIKKMNDGKLEDAIKVFEKLIDKHPDWAEAHNKYATVLFLLGNARLSLKACETVVRLKPDHFGAWNGMALCAAQLERWKTALVAARKALSIQPGAAGNLDLMQLAESKLRESE